MSAESFVRTEIAFDKIRRGMLISRPPHHDQIVRVTSLRQASIFNENRMLEGALLDTTLKPVVLQGDSGGWGAASVGFSERNGPFFLNKKKNK